MLIAAVQMLYLATLLAALVWLTYLAWVSERHD